MAPNDYESVHEAMVDPLTTFSGLEYGRIVNEVLMIWEELLIRKHGRVSLPGPSAFSAVGCLQRCGSDSRAGHVLPALLGTALGSGP